MKKLFCFSDLSSSPRFCPPFPVPTFLLRAGLRFGPCCARASTGQILSACSSLFWLRFPREVFLAQNLFAARCLAREFLSPCVFPLPDLLFPLQLSAPVRSLGSFLFVFAARSDLLVFFPVVSGLSVVGPLMVQAQVLAQISIPARRVPTLSASRPVLFVSTPSRVLFPVCLPSSISCPAGLHFCAKEFIFLSV
jgi:hypothetical protein